MIRYLFLVLALFAVTAVATPQLVLAKDVFQSGVCSEPSAKGSAVCNAPSTDPVAGPDGLLIKIAKIIAYVAGGAAIIVILYGSIRFVTSGGDAAKVKSARDAVIYSLIGIAVIALAGTLILFVLSKL